VPKRRKALKGERKRMSTPKQYKKEEQIRHKVLGLTGTEIPERAERKSFCDLCGATIAIGDSMFTLVGENEWKFCIHLDCTLALMTRVHNSEFRELVKDRPKTKKTQPHKKHQFIGAGTEYCCFCSFLIGEGELYSKAKKKRFHAEGKDSCYLRYQKAMNQARRELKRRF
jgi:hypothetical protein